MPRPTGQEQSVATLRLSPVTYSPAEHPRSLRTLAALFTISGALHLLRPGAFIAMVPAWLPAPALLVVLSGAAELAGAAGLLLPPTRRAAGWGLLALLVAVFPANIEMLRAAHASGGSTLWQSLLVLRLPLQPLLGWWIWRTAVATPREG